MKFNKIAIISGFALILFLSPFFVSADGPPKLEADWTPISAISTITGIVFGALIAVSVIFLIVAGFYFVTASGNDAQIQKARNMLMYAIVGIVIAILSQGIVDWLEGTFGGTP